MASAAVLALAASTATTARAEIHWHADLQTARAAAIASQKPVLAIFTASWSPEAVRFAERTLASPEVAALVTACYEPVLIDVDAQAAITKRMEIMHVPAACILAPKGGRLATFECPESPADFVAAAARAAQSAATRTIGQSADAEAGDGDAATQAGDLATGVGKEVVAPPNGGAIALVASKVRQLSDFATASEVSSEGLPPASMSRPAEVATSRYSSASVTDAPSSRFSSASVTDAPVLPANPSAWPGEQPARASSFTNAPPQPERPAIEPATSAPPAPWLAAPAATASAPAAPSTTVTELPEKPEATSSWSSFVSAFQKPFSIFTTKPAKTPAPPTMPPARPASPLAMATAAFTPPAAAAAEAPAADPYGSMPLGLEGYCPVTLAERGVWTEGRAQWGVRHRGRTYLFAGPEQQQAFLANPDRFSPALSGDDPVLAIEQGKSLPGRRAYGVTYQSRIYLFSSAESRAAFTANPERFTAPVMLAERPAPVDAVRRY
ncbi:MAG: thioredoxin family protein [Planctomycetia bacterium]|nr:thioredoxin family protein [Planctomycetia bacterium]